MRCLYCYKILEVNDKEFHEACSKKIFGTAQPPLLPYSEDDIEALAKEVIQAQTTLTGVQPKLSLHISNGEKKEDIKRFTIVGLWGGYILKPPSPNYPQLPEVEDLTMHLASIAKMNVVPHSLIRMKSNNLAYITKRIDRVKKKKVHMEDMCQLSNRLTEDKYHGSYEQISKAISKYSANPGLDVINFWEVVLFSFLTGNADMHLKNFSLINQAETGMVLSPSYDLFATALVNPADEEELALTLNGKKRKITKLDFIKVFDSMKLDKKQQSNIFVNMLRSHPKWNEMIDASFLSESFKKVYKKLINDRIERIA